MNRAIKERMPERILLFFIDGVGLGNDKPYNPLTRAKMPNVRKLLQGNPLILDAVHFSGEQVALGALDACLGIEGLPQSATGQASLLTGQNIAKVLGRHWPGLPTRTIQERLLKYSIFRTLKAQGKQGCFANYFNESYFDFAAKRRYPHSATTWSILAADLPVAQGGEVLKNGLAVYHDLTGKALADLGWAAPIITPIEAGRRLGRIGNGHDVTLYEYFLTDQAGHKKDIHRSNQVLEEIDCALGGILETFDLEKNLLLIVSDHGNIEDSRIKTHTKNPVPLLAVGVGAADIVSRAKDLTDLAPYLRWWGRHARG